MNQQRKDYHFERDKERDLTRQRIESNIDAIYNTNIHMSRGCAIIQDKLDNLKELNRLWATKGEISQKARSDASISLMSAIKEYDIPTNVSSNKQRIEARQQEIQRFLASVESDVTLIKQSASGEARVLGEQLETGKITPNEATRNFFTRNYISPDKVTALDDYKDFRIFLQQSEEKLQGLKQVTNSIESQFNLIHKESINAVGYSPPAATPVKAEEEKNQQPIRLPTFGQGSKT